jgi:hypothetical protein
LATPSVALAPFVDAGGAAGIVTADLHEGQAAFRPASPSLTFRTTPQEGQRNLMVIVVARIGASLMRAVWRCEPLHCTPGADG